MKVLQGRWPAMLSSNQFSDPDQFHLGLPDPDQHHETNPDSKRSRQKSTKITRISYILIQKY